MVAHGGNQDSLSNSDLTVWLVVYGLRVQGTGSSSCQVQKSNISALDLVHAIGSSRAGEKHPTTISATPDG